MTGLQFAEMGADVIKVEPPEGAPSRHAGPFADDKPTPITASTYWYYNASKRSVVIDLDSDDGRAELDRLLAGGRCVHLAAAPPTSCARSGLDLRRSPRAHPRLIVVSITAFGLTGPWADYQSSDLVALAASGPLISSGYDDHSIPPIRPGGNQAYHTAASFAHHRRDARPARAPADRRRRARRRLACTRLPA